MPSTGRWLESRAGSKLLTLPTEYKRTTCSLGERLLDMVQAGETAWMVAAVSPSDGNRVPVSAAWDIWHHQMSCGQRAVLQVTLPVVEQHMIDTSWCVEVVIHPAM